MKMIGQQNGHRIYLGIRQHGIRVFAPAHLRTCQGRCLLGSFLIEIHRDDELGRRDISQSRGMCLADAPAADDSYT